MEETIALLLQKYPVLIQVIMVIGILRVVNKPLFTFLHAFAAATPSKVDDKIVSDVEQSKIYKVISYVFDWFGSVKLPGKK
jgi:hypothetical protein